MQDVIKHYSARKFMIKTRNILKFVYEIPFLENHSITVGNRQLIFAHKMIALPLKIQDHYFEFLVLVVDILDEYEMYLNTLM